MVCSLIRCLPKISGGTIWTCREWRHTMHYWIGKGCKSAPEKLVTVDTENSSLSSTWSGKTDPMVFPKCQGIMRIISSIEDGLLKPFWNILVSGLSNQDLCPKHTPRLLPHTSWMIIFNYPWMTITSPETPNTPGTLISRL